MDWVELARQWIPRRVRYAIQNAVSLRTMKLRWFASRNPVADVLESDENRIGCPVRFGIIRNSAHFHANFVRACLEIGVPFRVIDLHSSQWLEHVEHAGCDVLLVWPDGFLSTWNAMIKDRVAILENELGYPCVPSSRELWMYEDKRRTAYWLAANGIHHPKTWILYDRDEAEAFVASCELPVVFKTSFGASGSGVQIMKSRRLLRAAVRKAFVRGIGSGGAERRDRQWGNILFQEYLTAVKEWRIVRIGDRFFSRRKEARGESYNSASGLVGWARPPVRVLDFAQEVTDLGQFRSMAVDLFETDDGRLLVNELQAVFGAPLARNLERGIEHRGVWTRDDISGEWRFEAGDFYRNACANERVRDALERRLRRIPPQQREPLGDHPIGKALF